MKAGPKGMRDLNVNDCKLLEQEERAMFRQRAFKEKLGCSHMELWLIGICKGDKQV